MVLFNDLQKELSAGVRVRYLVFAMKTFNRHPFLWSVLISVLAWAPVCLAVPEEIAVKRFSAVIPIIAFTLAFNYIGRVLFPVGGDNIRAVYEKHFNSILIGTMLCSLLGAGLVTMGVNLGAMIVLIPLLWQGVSLPTGGLMLPRIARELEAAEAANVREMQAR